ncbi:MULTISPECIES: NHLP leader peptide family RiPP precursor [Nitrospirillum]|uniref:Putative ribosomally synthesized peptide n=1 Tax=Nitrospirillum amazonense TaxID=28077 RepID=A0A560G392_9PROT|nr:NHLP leader peptide family RiPP precursor [Nitrospirillum amazonense]MEC4593960.1 NHLP leader peptide family RiPP precursor [Nitrospirillum amazonense]TWB28304.1 putative ribosomally synthesized peptide [Nitrospirillum amazonense]
MTDEDTQKITGRIIAKVWADETYKARLLADPAAVLTAEGLDLPEGVTFRVVQDAAGIQTLVLPARPADLSDDDLGEVAGGRPLPGPPVPPKLYTY